MEYTRRHDERNFYAWPPTARYVLIGNFIRQHDLRPREEFVDGVIIMSEWREPFLAYCRQRRIECGFFDFGFEEGGDPNATQQRPEPATPDRG